jgi:hypothetical protein
MTFKDSSVVLGGLCEAIYLSLVWLRVERLGGQALAVQ